MADIASQNSGNWSNPATWVGGVVPSTGDKAIIADTHNVLVDTNVDIGDGTNAAVDIQAGGTLDFHRTNNILFEVTGRIHVRQNGKIGNSSTSDRITGNVTIQLNKGNGNGINFGILIQGSFSFYGNIKTTNAVSTTNSLSGTNTITVNDATGWQIGDDLVIKNQQSFSNTSFHRTTILGVSGNNITLTDSLPFDVGIDAPVGNKTKNILFEQHPNANAGRNTAFYHQSIIGTIEGEHYAVKNTDSNTNTAQGCYCFRTTSDDGQATINVSDVCILGTHNLIRGLEFEAFRLPSATFNNMLIDLEANSGQNVLYPRSGATAVIQNSVFYGGGQFTSGWGQGSSAIRVLNCKLLMTGSSVAISLSTCITYTFEDCLIVGGNSNFRYCSFQDVGQVVFRRCKFGSTDNGWNIVKARIIDSNGTNGNQIIIFEDCTDTCTEDEMVEYGGGNTYTSVSDNSYLQFIRQNANEEEVYFKGGYIALSNEQTNLSERNARFERKFRHDLEHIWNAFIPSDIDIIASTYVYRGQSFQRTTDIHSSATSPTGTVTHSSAFTNEEGWEMFDDTLSQRWIGTNGTNDWVQYQFNSPSTIEAYALTAPRIAWIERALVSWRILGSNTGAFSGEETVIDQQINVPNWTDFERRLYQITPATFTYFRITVDGLQGDTSIPEITELEFLEIAPITTPNLEITSNSGINEVRSMSNTAEQWEALTATVQQTTGDLETLNLKFAMTDGLNGDLSYMDFIALSAYGYRSIFVDSLGLDPISFFIPQQLQLIPQITLTEAETAALTGLSLTFETTPQTSFGEDFSITLLADFTVNPNLTLNDIQTWYYYHSNRIQAFAGQETGYHLQEHLPFGQTVSIRKEYDGVQKGMRVIDQNGNIVDGFTSIQADNGNIVNNEKVTINATTPVGFDDEVNIFNTLSDAEDELNEIATGTTFFYQANQLGGNTVFFRMEKADGSFIIDSYILPSTAGVYDITLVVTDTDNSLTELLVTIRKLETMIEIDSGQNRFTQKALEESPSGGANDKGFIN